MFLLSVGRVFVPKNWIGVGMLGYRVKGPLAPLCLAFALWCGAGVVQAEELAGLWQGDVQISSVSAPGADNAMPSAGAFRLPVLLHIDDDGAVRLLKEAVLLRTDGATRLLADPSRHLPLLRAASDTELRRARRFTSAAFEFAEPSLAMTGQLGDAPVTGILRLEPGLPTHPFGHRYHPDHDNRDDGTGADLGTSPRAEVPQIERAVTLVLSEKPDARADQMTLDYSERVTGLTHEAIRVEGHAVLVRVSTIGELE